MEQKIYRIFVSSTYTDLIEERNALIQAIISMNHQPAGMELFNASNEEQFEYIKNVIDTCDYYVLILGGRYGTVNPKTGKSFTQMEFEYALSKQIPVVVFPRLNIENLPTAQKDADLSAVKGFTELAMNGRLCKNWTDKNDLQLKVAITLMEMFRKHPQTGWQRADKVDNKELLETIHKLNKEKADLLKELTICKQKLDTKPEIDDIADLNEKYNIYYKLTNLYDAWDDGYYYTSTWKDIAKFILPHCKENIDNNEFYRIVNFYLEEHINDTDEIIKVKSKNVQEIKYQMIAYKFIETFQHEGTEYQRITKYGNNFLMNNLVVKTKKPSA